MRIVSKKNPSDKHLLTSFEVTKHLRALANIAPCKASIDQVKNAKLTTYQLSLSASHSEATAPFELTFYPTATAITPELLKDIFNQSMCCMVIPPSSSWHIAKIKYRIIRKASFLNQTCDDKPRFTKHASENDLNSSIHWLSENLCGLRFSPRAKTAVLKDLCAISKFQAAEFQPSLELSSDGVNIDFSIRADQLLWDISHLSELGHSSNADLISCEAVDSKSMTSICLSYSIASLHHQSPKSISTALWLHKPQLGDKNISHHVKSA
jgi:hypothetical protein